MKHLLKRYGWVGLAAASAMSGLGFALHGPIGNGGDAYQTSTLFYNLPGDYGAPKNLGEEYRFPIPILYYAFDANFLDYFGSNGVWAVDQAFAIFNNLTNVSSYSADLSEFPMDSQRLNYRAQALLLLDVKSVMMGMIAERLGLAEPDRYTWCLRKREGSCGPPPYFLYEVIMRNFDPVTWVPTRYVNGTRYTYWVTDFCPTDQHEAFEIVVDPLTVPYNSLASYGFTYGGYFSTLSRDDMGGLRYMYRSPNMNVENLGAGTVRSLTNAAVTQLLVSSNLMLLAAQALTNDAGGLAALYPGLLITDTQPLFTNVVTAETIAYYTNLPWSPAGSPATLAFGTNYSTNVAVWYRHTFGNLITNTYSTNAFVTILTTNVAPPVWGLPGQVVTNVTARTVLTNMVAGDFFILPTNSECGFSVVSTQLIRLLMTTNTLLVATNAAAATNVNEQQYSESYVYYFTNRILQIHPVACVTNAVALMRGIERVQFIRRDYDSLLGQYFYPITSSYTNYAVTNNTLVAVPVHRVVTAPDIVISAADIRDAFPIWAAAAVLRQVTAFSQSNVLAQLAGPGTIEPPATFVFSKVGPVFFNDTIFADEVTAVGTNFVWGSFDWSTNEPVVYPYARTIMDLENMVLMQVLPTVLPAGRRGVAYPATPFSGRGGQTPYTWKLAPGSPGLPPGLTGLTALDQPSATLTGTPTQFGTFDFIVRMTDTNGRFVDCPLFVKIDP